MAETQFKLEGFSYRPHTIKIALDQYVHGQDNLKRVLAVAVWQHYSRLRDRLNKPVDPLIPTNKPNVLVIGDTGTGKTLTVSLTAKLLGVPFQYIDCTEYSEAGYVGGNVSDIPKLLYCKANKIKSLAELGIIYLDEIDKKAAGRFRSTDDVSRAGVQAAFLALIEGKEAEMDDEVTINTVDVLFVASGAFEGIGKIISEREGKIGFGRTVLSQAERQKLKPTIKDLENYGMNGQLLGRFPNLAYTDQFTAADLCAILKLDKNPLLKDAVSDFARLGITVDITETAYRKLAEDASKSPLGARSLTRSVNDALRDLFFELGEREIDQITIDDKLINNPKAGLEDLIRSAKLRDPQAPIVVVHDGSKVDKNEVDKDDSVKLSKLTRRDYKTILGGYGMNPQLLEAAASAGKKRRLLPLDVFGLVGKYNDEVNELKKLFQQDFGKPLDITDGCREALVEIGLRGRSTEGLQMLIYNPVWLKFKDKADEIKRSKVKRLTLEKEHLKDVSAFFDQLRLTS